MLATIQVALLYVWMHGYWTKHSATMDFGEHVLSTVQAHRQKQQQQQQQQQQEQQQEQQAKHLQNYQAEMQQPIAQETFMPLYATEKEALKILDSSSTPVAATEKVMTPQFEFTSLGDIHSSTKCTALQPRIILYNRIPKCASGSMNIFIEEAKARKNFTICRSSIYTSRHLKKASQKQYAQDPFRSSNCRNRPKKYQRGIMSRHIFYLDFKQFGFDQPAYMNIIRHPVDRCVSRYYYERDARGTVPGDMSLDKCMQNKNLCKFTNWNPSKSVAQGTGTRMQQMLEECSSNYLSRWFCGMDPVCSTNSREVLELAKKNMRDEFAFVGLTSEMKLSFAILQTILPEFFGAEDMPTDICNKCKKDTARDGSVAPKPALVSDKNRKLIANINAMDMELYDFAVGLFWKKAGACGFEGAEKRALSSNGTSLFPAPQHPAPSSSTKS